MNSLRKVSCSLSREISLTFSVAQSMTSSRTFSITSSPMCTSRARSLVLLKR